MFNFSASLNVITNEEMKVSAYALFIKAVFIAESDGSIGSILMLTLANFSAIFGTGAWYDFFSVTAGNALPGSVLQVGADLDHNIETGVVVGG